MKERPILFSAPMVRAILDGRKTMTRRVMKVQPPAEGYELATCISTTSTEWRREEGKQHWLKRDGYRVIDGSQPYFSCPYGQVGDRLWVRETFLISDMAEDSHDPIFYRADKEIVEATWKPSIHMPRWASRIDLEITGVRVERLQDISEADAKTEGIEQVDALNGVLLWRKYGDEPWNTVSSKHSFQTLWESINGTGSWAANPLVWVVEFKRVKP